MGGKKLTAKSVRRKGESTHPNSRRAAQMARVNHRTQKLNLQKKARRSLTSSKVDRLLTFILLLDPSVTHLPDLPSLHDFVSSIYLTRHDEELSELKALKRPGRPASKREIELEACIAREKEEYRTGIEIPDLTSEINVGLLRQWEGDSQASLMFRIVKISKSFPEQFAVVNGGRHRELEGTEKQKRDLPDSTTTTTTKETNDAMQVET